MKDLLLFPFGGNARESLLAIHARNDMHPTWNILGFLDDDVNLAGKTYQGIPVLGGREVLDRFLSSCILAVPGNPSDFLRRELIILGLGMPLDRFATVVDPSARISPDASIGKNTLVLSNAFIGSSVRLGNHCIVLPNSVVSHDAQVGDFSVIGASVTVSGSCSIGTTCYIGSGTSIREGIQIGHRSLVGLGACVVSDVPEGSFVAGNPARPILRRGGGQ